MVLVYNFLREKLSKTPFTRALDTRPFAYLWLGQTFSAIGDSAYLIALAWLVIVLTSSSTAIAVVFIVEVLARLLFLIIAGVVADRAPRYMVMLFSDRPT